jgi:hypothetical protein
MWSQGSQTGAHRDSHMPIPQLCEDYGSYSGSLKDIIFPRYLTVKGLLSNLVKACLCLSLVPG